MNDERRLIEDFLPIQPISKEAPREMFVHKGHISTLHLWWVRRPVENGGTLWAELTHCTAGT
jgi:putative DNA methylase